MALRPWLFTVLLVTLGVFLLICAAWWLDGRVYLQALFFLSYGLMAVPDRRAQISGSPAVESDRSVYVMMAAVFVMPVGLLALYFTVDFSALPSDTPYYLAAVGLHLLLVFGALDAWRKLRRGINLPSGDPLPHA